MGCNHGYLCRTDHTISKCMDGKLYIADCPYGSYCPGGTYDCVYVDSQKKVSRKKYDFYQDIVYESLH
ncbi:hypothetical protein IWW52_000058 [Coemansia sp. RSA 2704]|nr:hypothetical protein IWW52_000058 [Coemansia sp. RSA 2704]